MLVNFAITGHTTPYQSFTILGAIFLILGAFSFLIALLADMLGRMRETQESLLYLEKRRYYDDLTRQQAPLDVSRDALAPTDGALEQQEEQLVAPMRTE